jgi:PilZ domain
LVVNIGEGYSVALVESDKRAGGERILPRHQFEARVKIEVIRDGQTRLIEGWARDLSESGLGAFVGTELVSGELAMLRIPLNNEMALVIPGKVVRNLGTEYGFQFTALSRKQRDQIRSVLAAKRIIPYLPTPG